MIRVHDGGVSVDVLVQPRASRNSIGPVHDERLKISITAPPVDNEANTAVIALLAKKLDVPQRSVTVVSGHSSRRKTVRIEGIASCDIEELCG